MIYENWRAHPLWKGTLVIHAAFRTLSLSLSLSSCLSLSSLEFTSCSWSVRKAPNKRRWRRRRRRRWRRRRRRSLKPRGPSRRVLLVLFIPLPFRYSLDAFALHETPPGLAHNATLLFLMYSFLLAPFLSPFLMYCLFSFSRWFDFLPFSLCLSLSLTLHSILDGRCGTFFILYSALRGRMRIPEVSLALLLLLLLWPPGSFAWPPSPVKAKVKKLKNKENGNEE